MIFKAIIIDEAHASAASITSEEQAKGLKLCLRPRQDWRNFSFFSFYDFESAFSDVMQS